MMHVFWTLLDALIGLFMAPGAAILHALRLHTNTLSICLVAFVFWAIFFGIVGAMQNNVRQFLTRNSSKK